MIRSGVDIQTVGRIVGHSNSTMTMHYAHGDPEAIKKAIFELNKAFESVRFLAFGQYPVTKLWGNHAMPIL
jgi:hypothetical protein